MTPSDYSAITLVQQTIAEYLREKLDWAFVFPYNRKDYGPDGLLERKDDREIVLARDLRAALAELNPDLPDAAYNDATRQIVATPAT